MTAWKILTRAALAAWLFAWPLELSAQQSGDPLLTVAESSGFTKTSTSAEVEAYIEHYAQAEHITRFDYGTTVEARPMAAAIVAKEPFEVGSRDSRLRVLLLGNIHSGECSGKEGLLIMLRKLAQDPDHPWLKDMVIVFAPNYNADGNDRMGLNHRPGQIGPEQGMGLRENAQHLDLNRDFGKIESPEAQSLIEFIDELDPHLFIDCHTTNGSRHRYGVTYDVPHNPSSPQPIRDFMRKSFMPAVTEQLDAKGLHTFYYGNFNRDKTAWESFGHEPRYSTEYVGLRSRLAILCEDYSYSPYERRVLDSELFVGACLDVLQDNAEAARRLIDDVEKEFVQRAADNPASLRLALDAKVVPFPEPVAIKTVDADGNPQDVQVSFVADYQPANEANLPFAYIIPPECSRVADRLRRHGIQVEAVTEETVADVDVYSITDLKRSNSLFQRHAMIAADVISRTERRTIAKGMYYVSTAQPLGRLVFYFLEPASNDGFVTWNFFDPDLRPGTDYPVWRLNANTTVVRKPVGVIPPWGRISLEMIYGPNGIRTRPAPRPRWMPGGTSYTFEWDGRPVLVDAISGSMSRNPANDRNSLRGAFEKIAGLSAESIDKLLASTPKPSRDEKCLLFAAGRAIYQYDVATKSAVPLAPLEADVDLFEVGPRPGQVGIVAGNNLFVTTDKGLWQVTTNGDDNHLNGKLDWVYQEELFGRGTFTALWFNAAGSHAAFLTLDETHVPRYSVADHRHFGSLDERSPYPNAGDPLPRVGLSVADIGRQAVQSVDLSRYGDTEIVISSVGWDLVGSRVIFSVQNRGQTWLDVCAADPATGHTTVLVHDKSPAWIRTPGQPLFLQDGDFFWLSTRSGHQHIYRYHSNGELVGPVTEGDWQVSQLQGISADEQYLYFTGMKDSPLRTQLYRVQLGSNEIQLLTDPQFDHAVDFNSTKGLLFDTISSASMPPMTLLLKADGTLVRSIWFSPDDTFNHLGIRKPEFVEVPTRDGGTMDALMILPPDWDESKKYPVIVSVYGGPQSPSVRDQFRAAGYLWHQHMAQQGYVIWICDNRSSSRRGLAAAWATHGRLGESELADVEDGLDWLAQKPWIDAERIGIWGWSYGGFLTSYAMTHSTRFKAGFAGAPVTDWRNYDAIYTERLMKLPSENLAGYDSTSVVKAAGNLHGKLLLVHGTIDDNVHMSNTLQLAAALQAAQKPFELMLYPGSRHGVQDAEQELHLWRMVTNFFLENL